VSVPWVGPLKIQEVNPVKKLLAAAALFVPTVLFAQSPFDGTWRTNLDQSKFSPKPIVYSLNNGMYDCTSCAPEVHIKADGTDQPVTGQANDTLAVKEVDPRTSQLVAKKNGKTIWELKRTVSQDGKTMNGKGTSYPPESTQPVTWEVILERIGNPGAGNAISGSWRMQKLSESENDLLGTYKESGNELSISSPTGWNYTAKFDGKDCPVKGDYGVDSVSLKKIDDHTIEASYKRGGKLMEVDKITVSTDGKTMTIVSESKLTGRISTYVATKQ